LIPLFLLLCLTSCAPVGAQEGPALRLDSVFVWHHAAPWFGGLSGAEVSSDGTEITVVTDRGRVAQGQMIRKDGKLAGIDISHSASLKSPDGRVLGLGYSDAEGLAKGANGHLYASFEHDHRVVRLHPRTGLSTPLRAHPDFAKLQPNSGLEALAIHPDGSLFALPERSGGQNKPFPVYVFNGSTWVINAHIPRRGPFLPVGADFADNGDLYVLERAITPLGFRSRIRRFTLDAPYLGEVTLFTSRPGQFDNLESLSIWRDSNDQTRLSLISDDNFFAIQQTQVVELTLAPSPQPD
tara:strand:+ start:156294 stop:157181 length:888 start_codon:yes stop_codon:yes gene_type:complete